VLAGALVAPFLLNALLALGRAYPPLEGLRDLEFRRVLSRCITVAVLAGMVPLLRRGGFLSRTPLGIPPVPGAFRPVAAGWLAGIVVVALVLGLGCGLGAYHFFPRSFSGSDAAHFLAVGLVVALVEELFFRGVVFGALRRDRGFAAAAVGASLFYSLLHFAKPTTPLAVVHAQWDSGLIALRYTFATLWPLSTTLAPVLTLLVLGVVLCRLYERQGHLYGAMGLHAGLVWAMLMGREVVERDTTRWVRLFGYNETVTSAWAAFPIALLFLGAVFWYTREKPGR
jgi:membrane protease YdiL (CAAX protease family)